jgi:hypothetical protein
VPPCFTEECAGPGLVRLIPDTLPLLERAYPAAHALEPVRTSCDKPAAHRQEPAAHELFRQLDHQTTLLGVLEAELASLFSEATALCWDQGPPEDVADQSRQESVSLRAVPHWRYHRPGNAAGLGVASTGQQRGGSDEAIEQGDEQTRSVQGTRTAAPATHPRCSTGREDPRGQAALLG